MIFRWRDQLAAFYEERLSFQTDQLKILREIYEVRANVQDERIKILEARITNLDGWIQTVATTKGLGMPDLAAVPGEYEEDLDIDFDPEDDMTLMGLIDPYAPELREEEEETEEVIHAE